MSKSPKQTEEYRRKLFLQGSESLFFFIQAILGNDRLSEQPHLELCKALDGTGEWGAEWKRGMVCASRGFLKTTIGTIGWASWMALYNANWSCRILGATFENAKLNFYDPIMNIFVRGPRSQFLRWLYTKCICDGDAECRFCGGTGVRIPEGFEGWNERQIVMSRSNPLAKPAITFKGISSDQEGYHGNAIIIDDPEGADTERHESGHIDAERALAHCVPLLVNPLDDKILLVLTPHGTDPLAYRVLDQEGGTFDNAKREWKVWWKPIVDGGGNSNWPSHFTPDAVDFLRRTTDLRVWEQQYLLKRVSSTANFFDRKEIESGMYKWVIAKHTLEYPIVEMDEKEWTEKGKMVVRERTGRVKATDLRFYLHVDLVHRADTVTKHWSGGKRPSKAAFTVTAVSPDFHVFVIAYWTDRASLDEQVSRLFDMYREYGPFEVSFDPVGAQSWFKDFVQQAEKTDLRFQRMESKGVYGPKRKLPRLSSRMIEDKRVSSSAGRLPKEEYIYERLSAWIQTKTLHFHVGQDEMLAQVYGFPDNTEYVDLVDSLAQGPPLWKPGLLRDKDQEARRKTLLLRQATDKYTGYFNPYRDDGLAIPASPFRVN